MFLVQVPPPPLAPASPHSWQDPPTPAIQDRWRKMSWAAGENSSAGAVASPPRAHYYNYQKPLHQSRPRTLVEVPLQTPTLQHDRTPLVTPASLAANNPINIFQSTLDPNSRPFTPASVSGATSPVSITIEDMIGSCSGVSSSGPRNVNNNNSCGLSLVSSTTDPEEMSASASEGASFLELTSEKSLSITNTSGLDSLSSSKQLEASKLSEDPLPEDPKSLLPQLDISQDQDESKEDVQRPPSSNTRFSLIASDASLLPPPVFPFATWSGKSRPPLLPTPKNFPPFGPRQPKQVPLFEDDVALLGSCSPKMRMIQGQGKIPFASYLPPSTSLYQDVNANNTAKKPDMFASINPNSAVHNVKHSSSWPRPEVEGGLLANLNMSTETRPWRSSHPVKKEEVPPPSPKQKETKSSNGWEPEVGGLMSCSLIESYPVPDEYFTSKVIGSKLPSVKLFNCHTDLLFFIFYSFQADHLQLVAATLLFERGWRYHKQDQVWLARWPGVSPDKKTVEWEEGLYQYFDVKVWKRIPGWFRLNYDQLAEKPGVTEQDIPLKQM